VGGEDILIGVIVITAAIGTDADRPARYCWSHPDRADDRINERDSSRSVLRWANHLNKFEVARA
jgi:hypothetical protein